MGVTQIDFYPYEVPILFCHIFWVNTLKVKSCNLLRNSVVLQVAALMLCVIPPTHATNFHVTESRSDVYFLQHENLLHS